ncbi:MAG: flavodoxin domain-containing protein [Eubacteriales bacterium]|nr:flavodoxin domain-containing protein [Eubacteriales bacterium]
MLLYRKEPPMKITIAYATKTGTSAQAARQLADILTARGYEAAAYDLAAGKPDMTADAFVLGGSIRMGRWHGRARRFARANEAALLRKPLALFACRCGKEDLRTLFAKQIGEKLVAHAVFVDGFGGDMLLEKQKGLDRFFVKMALKSGENGEMSTGGVDEQNMNACADALIRALVP